MAKTCDIVSLCLLYIYTSLRDVFLVLAILFGTLDTIFHRSETLTEIIHHTVCRLRSQFIESAVYHATSYQWLFCLLDSRSQIEGMRNALETGLLNMKLSPSALYATMFLLAGSHHNFNSAVYLQPRTRGILSLALSSQIEGMRNALGAGLLYMRSPSAFTQLCVGKLVGPPKAIITSCVRFLFRTLLL